MKIGIDFDDVLMSFDAAMLDWHNRSYGTSLTREKDISTDLETLFQASIPETVKRILLFYKTPEHAAIEPIDGAVEGVRILAQKHELHIITARPKDSQVETEALVQKFFPNLFAGVHFTDHFLGGGKKKSEVCQELGIELFIDDSMNNAVDVSTLGIPVLLLDAPWNQVQTPPGVKRVFSWNDIIEAI